MARPTRFYSSRQEKRVAKAVNGKQVANSGAPVFVAGDVRNDLFLLECKTHTEFRNNFTIKHEWIDKNREEAFQMGKHHAALVIDFGDNENHYLISERDFLSLLEYMRDNQ